MDMSEPMLLHLKHQKLYIFLFYILGFNTLSFYKIVQLLKWLLFPLCNINKKITFLKIVIEVVDKDRIIER